MHRQHIICLEKKKKQEQERAKLVVLKRHYFLFYIEMNNLFASNFQD